MDEAGRYLLDHLGMDRARTAHAVQLIGAFVRAQIGQKRADIFVGGKRQILAHQSQPLERGGLALDIGRIRDRIAALQHAEGLHGADVGKERLLLCAGEIAPHPEGRSIGSDYQDAVLHGSGQIV